MGLSAEESEKILLAAPLHDIGKIGTPDHILLKRGSLTQHEFESMKLHTLFGSRILSESASPILQAGAQIAISHHEKFDGSGYPKGLKGKAIPLGGRIVALADVFDALTTERPYKAAWTLDRACSFIVDSKGRHFDPDVVNAFFDTFDDVLKVMAHHEDPIPVEAAVIVEQEADSVRSRG